MTRFVILAALILLPPTVQVSAQTAEPPRVRLIATGGTISNRSSGRLTAEELVTLIPNLTQYARVESEQFANVASSQLTLKQWLRLSHRVNDVLAQDPGLAGVVITSGTDTLEETAYFLHLTVRSDRPVVVVGAMRNPSTLGYEGAANLQQAFRVAAAATVARERHARRAERRNQLGPGSDQDRLPATPHVPDTRLRRPGCRRP